MVVMRIITALSPRTQHLAEHIYERCGSPDLLSDTSTYLQHAGIPAAVASRDTPKLVDWLLYCFSFQGVSDAIAQSYIDQHGQASWRDIHDSH
jgi:hypothetical protein